MIRSRCVFSTTPSKYDQMTKIHCSALLNVDANTYFIERDGSIFRQLVVKALGLGCMEFHSETWSEEGCTTVRLITKPDLNWVPKALRSRVDESKSEFIDHITYRTSSLIAPPYTLEIKTESTLLKDKLDVNLVLTIEPKGVQQCLQSLEGSVKVHIPGIGSIISASIKDSLATSYRKLPGIVDEWLDIRKHIIETNQSFDDLLIGRPAVGLNIHWIREHVLGEGQPVDFVKLPPTLVAEPPLAEPDAMSAERFTLSAHWGHAILSRMLQSLHIMALLVFVVLVRVGLIHVQASTSQLTSSSRRLSDRYGKHHRRTHSAPAVLPRSLSPQSIETAHKVAAAHPTPSRLRHSNQRDAMEVVLLARSISLNTHSGTALHEEGNG